MNKLLVAIFILALIVIVGEGGYLFYLSKSVGLTTPTSKTPDKFLVQNKDYIDSIPYDRRVLFGLLSTMIDKSTNKDGFVTMRFQGRVTKKEVGGSGNNIYYRVYIIGQNDSAPTSYRFDRQEIARLEVIKTKNEKQETKSFSDIKENDVITIESVINLKTIQPVKDKITIL